MEAKEKQLMELLGLTARTLTHLTAAITTMSFELLRSEDKIARETGRRMIDRMATISSELDAHWQIIGEMTGVNVSQDEVETIIEIEMLSPPSGNAMQ
ncbi:hypothetical protein [Pseudomonas japonica]|uniref:hypothetical protein n=1 Tax=Pseudomonas japonica TaxID=256466 RepID=UPI0015E2A353|nr:hypothetical protein [Pseudomonas japonica]MBA1244836.1 hypothetical protein [Pseudomonas japonica]MBA1287117.1 hypothetical protein [Pseudomonas japonica]